MDKKTQSQLATNEWQTYMIKNYLQTQLSGMIRVFHGRYSAYITPEQMAAEITNTNKLINDMKIEFTYPSTTSQIQGPIPNNLVTTKQTIQPKQIVSRVANDVDRCHGRVWGATDHLIWRLGDGRVVYGCQCKRPKSQGSKYCAKHTKKLTHEDWFTEPSDTMRRHFLKATA